jgi:hypothetical protein
MSSSKELVLDLGVANMPPKKYKERKMERPKKK